MHIISRNWTNCFTIIRSFVAEKVLCLVLLEEKKSIYGIVHQSSSLIIKQKLEETVLCLKRVLCTRS